MEAKAPMLAKAKKTNPVTSSHSCPRTRPKWAAVARPAFITAAKVRVRRTCCTAIRVAMPIFRAVDTFGIAIDFIKLRRYNERGARSVVTQHCDP
jgi:hypothetical protein